MKTNRKRSWKTDVFLWLLGACLPVWLLSCEAEQPAATHRHEANYTCPMHPQVVEATPGTCPVCGMDLVAATGHRQVATVADSLDALLQPASAAVVSSIRTVTPQQVTRAITTTAQGTITYDTRSTYTVPARFGGRIEKLWVRYPLQPVRKGQKLLELYSPDIVTAQQELLFLLKTDPDNQSLMAAARQKLRLLGVTEAQIKQIVNRKEAQYALAIYSPYDGYVVAASAASSASESIRNGMQENRPGSQAPRERAALHIREGMYVDQGQPLFQIINPERLWAEFNLYADQAPALQVGDSVTIAWQNASQPAIRASVDVIQPFFSEGETFKKVRVYLAEVPTSLRIGQLVSASFGSSSDNRYWIPRTAVLDLGLRKVVFVKEDNAFRPQEVTVGRSLQDQVELISGISPQTAIAYHAQLLVDSESLIRLSHEGPEAFPDDQDSMHDQHDEANDEQ